MPTLRCCISVGTIRVCVRVVCVCVRVCGVVPFAVDFSLSQIGKMVLALLDRGGCCCCCLLQPKGKTQQTGNKQETNTQKQRRLVTQDTRTYTTHTKSIRVLHNLCHHHVARAVCVEQKGGKKEKKGKGGETRKQQQQEHDGNTYIQTIKIKTRLTMERWI